MSTTGSEQALLIIAWSRIWSPLVNEDMRASAWQALDLPDDYENHKAEYWTTFHVGAPEPQVPLVLHAALHLEGSGVREDWLRTISYLELSWDDVHLPPDQLGAACEIYACAIERKESVLVEELRSRYLLPWCEVAGQSLFRSKSHLLPLVKNFAEDLAAIKLD
jgi:TorA maturation chaperone TorD